MAEPCVDDTDTIELVTAGTPAVLTANVRNPAGTFSATQGDDATHVVTDNDTPHIQTQTDIITNAGSAPLKGLVIATFNPIWAGLPDGAGCSLIWEASLTINGVLVDQRDIITQELAEDEVLQFCPGVCLGQISLAIGASATIIWEKRITNDGASVQWSFRMGGDKLEATLGY